MRRVHTLRKPWLWHNRARAKICRNLKNHPPDSTLRSQLVGVIIDRLRTGRFYEQFSDQLAMAIRFDAQRMKTAAERLLDHKKDYVRRYARRVLHSVESIPTQPDVAG